MHMPPGTMENIRPLVAQLNATAFSLLNIILVSEIKGQRLEISLFSSYAMGPAKRIPSLQQLAMNRY